MNYGYYDRLNDPIEGYTVYYQDNEDMTISELASGENVIHMDGFYTI